MNTTETPIDNSINTLEQYMLPAQNANLVKILEMGEEWKKEGEELKQERWEHGKTDNYRFLWKLFSQLKDQWEVSQMVKLDKIGYFSRSTQVKNKFVNEFVEDYVIYDRVIHKTRSLNTAEGYMNVLAHLQKGVSEGDTLKIKNVKEHPNCALEVADLFTNHGGLKNGVHISFSGGCIGDEGAIAMSDMLARTGGLREGVEFDLGSDNLTDFGIGYFANVLQKTGGLRKGARLDIGGNNFTVEGFALVANAIEKTGGLREGVTLELELLNQTTEGIKSLMDAINRTGGLRVGVQIYLIDSGLTDECVKLIAEMIKKSGGLKPAVVLDLRENKLTATAIEYMLDAIESTGGMPDGAAVDMSQEHYDLLPGQQERIEALNGHDVDNGIFVVNDF